jgi:Sec-independent protein translocase protein TatA
MQAGTGTTMLALFNLGGGETVLILALVLVPLLAGRLPEVAKGLREGWREFFKAMRELDKESFDAGRSAGGIYGKPAAQTLTPDNHVAELYDPAVLAANRQTPKHRRAIIRVLAKIWRWIRRFLSA